MTSLEVREHLQALAITATELAQLMGVGVRTARRWTDLGREAEPIPMGAERALRAWRTLHRRGLPWRPHACAVVPPGLGLGDGVDDAAPDDLAPEDTPDRKARGAGEAGGVGEGHRLAALEQALARQRLERLQVREIVEGVHARGGPRAPWDVDFKRGRATLGPMLLTFVRLAGGGFVPQSVERADQAVDMPRDWPLIEDALACIARSLARAGEAAWPALELTEARGLAERGERGERAEQLQRIERVVAWEDAPWPTLVMTVACAAVRHAAAVDAAAWQGASGEDCVHFVNVNRAAFARLVAEARHDFSPSAETGLTHVRLTELHMATQAWVLPKLGRADAAESPGDRRRTASVSPA